MSRQIAILALTTLLLTACGSDPQRKIEMRSAPAPVVDRTAVPIASGGYLEGDGPGMNAPGNLDNVPDAVPKPEPLHRYANRPYVALGRTYTPLTAPVNYKERGIASWYGKKFHGQATSSGEPYDMYAMTAAHPTLPIPSYARVTHKDSGKYVVVRVNDRGPFLRERVIDLSYTAAHKLGIIGSGSSEVEIESVAAEGGANVLVMPDKVDSRPLDKAVAVTQHAQPVAGHAATSHSVYLQLGAFKSQEAAENFLVQMRAALGDTGSRLSTFVKDGLTRVHLGPYVDKHEARSNADSLKKILGFKPMLNFH